MKAILFSLVLLTSFQLRSMSGDTLRRPWSMGVSPQFGYLVPHTKQVEHLIQGHSYGGHLYFFKPCSGKSYWHYAYNTPEEGLDFVYNYTGNNQQLGSQFTSSFLLNLPLNRKKNNASNEMPAKRHRYTHWIGLGLGAGYSTKIWNLETNHQAAVLGTHFNIALTLQYSMRVIQFNNAEIRAGLRIGHFSNGAFQIPNLGTNNAAVFLSYLMTRKRPALSESLYSKPVLEKYRITGALSIGLKEIPPPNGVKYPAFVFSLLAENRHSYKSSFGLGADLMCNTSIKTLAQRRTDAVVTSLNVTQLGVVFSYSLHFNDFELKMQQGYYLHDYWALDGRFYHRFGLRYRVNEKFLIQLMLKTHFAKADYGELGLGYAIHRNGRNK